MKVAVDQDKCVSSGQCVLNATDVFDQRDDDGVVVLLDEHPPAQHQESVYDAVTRCPAAVIEVHDAD